MAGEAPISGYESAASNSAVGRSARGGSAGRTGGVPPSGVCLFIALKMSP
jgi:hypothetical protein